MHAVKTVTEDVQNPAAEISPEEAAQYSPRAQLGDEVRIEIDASKFGRIATQTAKQVIIQGIREAERRRIRLQRARDSQRLGDPHRPPLWQRHFGAGQRPG